MYRVRSLYFRVLTVPEMCLRTCTFGVNMLELSARVWRAVGDRGAPALKSALEEFIRICLRSSLTMHQPRHPERMCRLASVAFSIQSDSKAYQCLACETAPLIAIRDNGDYLRCCDVIR